MVPHYAELYAGTVRKSVTWLQSALAPSVLPEAFGPILCSGGEYPSVQANKIRRLKSISEWQADSLTQ